MEAHSRSQDYELRQHDIDVGDFLRRTRQEYGKTLSDVERVLRIRECQIKAIEDGDIAKLPGRVYAIGFVRTYAEYLGLDGGEVVKQFKAQYMDAQPRQMLEFPIDASDSKTPPIWLAVVLALVGVMGGVYWMQQTQHDRSAVTAIVPLSENVAARLDARSSAADVVADDSLYESESFIGPPAPPEPEQAKILEADQQGITLHLVEDSWVEIKNSDGKVIVSNVLKTGDKYFVPDNPGMTMSLGNAGGVEIVLGGRVMKPLGRTGDIRRDIPLDTAYLKTLEFKEIEPPPTSIDDLPEESGEQ